MGLLENEFGSLYVKNLFGANSMNQQKYFIQDTKIDVYFKN